MSLQWFNFYEQNINFYLKGFEKAKNSVVDKFNFNNNFACDCPNGVIGATHAKALSLNIKKTRRVL